MNWYSNITTADAQWNWNSFNRTLLQTVGVGGAVMALMIYYNMDKQHAEKMVAEQPQQVEQQLQQIPKQELLRLTDRTSISPPPSQPAPQTEPPAVEQPQPSASSFSEDEIKQQIIQHEGREHMAYPDTRGNMTVGIGFNLERKDAKSLLSSVGADFASVYRKKTALNDEQIDQLFSITLNEAINIAHHCVPNLDSHPSQVQKAVIDMAFNLGPNLANFKMFIQNLNKKDYRAAAKEMVNSRWYGQVGQRGPALVRMVNEAANPR